MLSGGAEPVQAARAQAPGLSPRRSFLAPGLADLWLARGGSLPGNIIGVL